MKSRPEFESMLYTELTYYLFNANTVKYGEEMTIAVGGKMSPGRSTLQKQNRSNLATIQNRILQMYCTS